MERLGYLANTNLENEKTQECEMRGEERRGGEEKKEIREEIKREKRNS